MSTAQTLIFAAYQMLGYYAPNETMSGADSALGLQQLNMMLDSWSNEPQACYAILEQSFALVVNKSSYTIGTSGSPDINTTRPLAIIDTPGAAYIQDLNGNNYEVNVATRQTWNELANRTTQTNSTIPNTLFYDPQMPNGVINLWPTPNSGGYTCFFDSYQPFVQASTLVSNITLPPGYELAIESNLAVLLQPFCKNTDVPKAVERLANKSLATIKRTNRRRNQAQFDREIVKSGYPNFNIYTGRYYP